MILGFTLLLNLLQNPLETLLLNVLLKTILIRDKALKFIVLKNMKAHRKRNN